MKVLSIVDGYAHKIAGLMPEAIVALSLRLSVFFVFWNSVQTKIVGMTVGGQHLAFWNVTDNTILLFEYEYGIPLIPYNIAAYMASWGEFFLSLGLLFGFLTRFSAIGLFIMTLVIQIFVYPGAWTEHLLWGAVLLAIVKYGPGSLSLDAVLNRR